MSQRQRHVAVSDSLAKPHEDKLAIDGICTLVTETNTCNSEYLSGEIYEK